MPDDSTSSGTVHFPTRQSYHRWAGVVDSEAPGLARQLLTIYSVSGGVEVTFRLADDYCWAHDPESDERRRQAYREGGFGRANAKRAGKLVPGQLRPLFTTLVMALRDVRDGRLDPRRATAMACLVGAMCRLFPLIDIEQRLEALERELRREVRHLSS